MYDGKKRKKLSSEESYCLPYEKRVKRYSRRRLVPIVRIYGKLKANNRSVRVNVYGFYPKIHIHVSCELSQSIIDAVVSNISNHLREWDCIKKRTRHDDYNPVLACRVVKAFPGVPFEDETKSFLELTLAYPEYVREVVMHVYNRDTFSCKSESNQDDSRNIKWQAYSNIDTVTQFQIQTNIHAFGWICINNACGAVVLDEPSEFSFAKYEINVGLGTSGQIVAIESDTSIGCLRAMCFDIECLKTTGMPDPKKDAIILICGQCSELDEGSEVKESTRNFVLQLKKSVLLFAKDNTRDVHICFETENDLLDAFSDLLKTFDPDFIVGHNHVGFDIPYITTRAHTIGSDARFIGKRSRYTWLPSREIIRKRKSGEVRKSFKTDTTGRIQIDTMLYIQRESKESSYRLDSLA